MNEESSIVKEMREHEECEFNNSTDSNKKNIQQKDTEIHNNDAYPTLNPNPEIESGTELYKKLVENLLEGIVILDFRGNVLYANQAMANLFGFDSIEEATDKNALDFIDPKYRKRVIRDQLLVRFGEGGFLSTYEGIKKTGKKFGLKD